MKCLNIPAFVVISFSPFALYLRYSYTKSVLAALCSIFYIIITVMAKFLRSRLGKLCDVPRFGSLCSHGLTLTRTLTKISASDIFISCPEPLLPFLPSASYRILSQADFVLLACYPTPELFVSINLGMP